MECAILTALGSDRVHAAKDLHQFALSEGVSRHLNAIAVFTLAQMKYTHAQSLIVPA